SGFARGRAYADDDRAYSDDDRAYADDGRADVGPDGAGHVTAGHDGGAYGGGYDDGTMRATVITGDGDTDSGLRPRSLDDFIGQPRVREQLHLVLTGAAKRGTTPDHIL